MTIRGFDTPVNCANLADAIKAAGYAYVARYYGPPSSRNKTLLSRGEAEALSRAGLDIVSIWEGRGDRATFTAANGGREAEQAVALAQAIGQPEGSAIYFAVDYDASKVDVLDRIIPYFKAVKAVLGSRYKVGAYGSGAVCDALIRAGLVAYTMLACASGWRGSRGYVGADIKQGLPTTEHGLPIDPETIVKPHASTADVGAWHLDVTSVTDPIHPVLREGDKGPAVAELQRRLIELGYDPGPVDADFGPRTDAAVRQFQTDRKLMVDGVAGSQTWGALA